MENCPHCGEKFTIWEPSTYSGWGHDMLYCDNDECAYFVQGRRKICMEFEKTLPTGTVSTPKPERPFPLLPGAAGNCLL